MAFSNSNNILAETNALADLNGKPKTTTTHSFAFIFPVASGHTNPSLGLARTLRKQGHQVSYLSREALKAAIEDTGATFYSNTDFLDELYENRVPDVLGALNSLQQEYGLENEDLVTGRFKLSYVHTLLSIPGTVRWLREVGATAVLFDPLSHFEASMAAKVASIPSAALLTTAGPGSLSFAFRELVQGSVEDFLAAARAFEPGQLARASLRSLYGLALPPVLSADPFGRIDCLDYCDVTLVTTSENLQDPMDDTMAKSYEGLRMEFVGPLLDEAGSKRCTGQARDDSSSSDGSFISEEEILVQVRQAHQQQRPVILVSMGTVITSTNRSIGWSARSKDSDGNVVGLTGKELCQAAWAGSFDAFGSTSEEEGPLLVVALGHREDALEGLYSPPNAILAPTLPQVDLLRAGISVFLTHGGQNSFTEALRYATPMVVCPGFGDQPINGRKAVNLGVGLSVTRPIPSEERRQTAISDYRSEVCRSLRRVLAEPSFKERAEEQALELEMAGGVPRAVDILLEMADRASSGEGVGPSVAARNLGA